MKKTTLFAATLTIAFASSGTLADAACQGPLKDGNTWTLTCTADSAGNKEYQCDYTITTTNTEGTSDTVSASGSVSSGQQGVEIWTGTESRGSAIVSASSEGSCTEK